MTSGGYKRKARASEVAKQDVVQLLCSRPEKVMFSNALAHGSKIRLQKKECPYQVLNVHTDEDIEEQELDKTSHHQDHTAPKTSDAFPKPPLYDPQTRIRSILNSQLKLREDESSILAVSKDFFHVLQKERDLSFLDRLDKSQTTSQLSLTQLFKKKNAFPYAKTAASTHHNTNDQQKKNLSGLLMRNESYDQFYGSGKESKHNFQSSAAVIPRFEISF
jgi:hypothetical protein